MTQGRVKHGGEMQCCRLALTALALLLPGLSPADTVPTHKLIGTLDGKRIELGEVHFTLQQALTPDIGLDQTDVAALARKYFGTDKPTLKTTFTPQPGSRHAGNYYDKAPIAHISVTFGDAGPDKPLSLAAEQVRNLSLGQAELCDLMQGNPIHIGTGNKYQSEPLFTVASPGRPFAFTLSYNSQRDENGPAGHGWSHAFSARLHYEPDKGVATVRRADGKTLAFTGRYTGASRPWQAEGARPDRLLFPDDETLIWRNDAGRHVFDTTGRLTRIENPAGHGQTLQYDPNGRLVSIQDDFGPRITLTYDQDQLTTITDPAGGTWRLSHDAAGKLTALTRPDGSVRHYRYTDKRFPHHLTAIIDAEGRPFAHFAYDKKGRAIESSHGQGKDRTDVTDITYTDTGDRLVNGTRYHLRLLEGHWTITEVERAGHEKGDDKARTDHPHTCSGVLKREYTPDGHLARTIDETGRITTYTEYDGAGRPGTLAQGPRTAYQRLTHIDYQPLTGRPARLTRDAPNGQQITEIAYDAHGNPISLDSHGRAPDGKGVRTEIQATYDALDRPVAVDGPLAGEKDTVRYDYYPDDPGAGSNRAHLKSVTAPDGSITRLLQYDPFGRPLKLVHPNGLTETRQYNTLGQLTRRTLTDATGNNRTETRQYDQAGLPVKATAPDGTTAIYAYNSAHKLTTLTTPNGTTTTYAYDKKGRTTTTTTAGATTKTTYKHRDQPTQITLPDKTHLRYSYDMAGRLTSLTDPLGRSTKLEYDLLGRIQQLTDPAGHKVFLAYDPLDDLTALTDTIGTRTTYTHDDLGQRRTETSPDRGTLTYDYDAAGKRTRTTDATGRSTKTTHNVLGRAVSVTHTHEGKKLTVTYTYGKTGGALGKVTRIQEPTATQTYAYTPFGDLKGYTQAITKGPTTTLTWTHDTAGRPTTLSLPGGEVLRYTYDKAGRTTSLTLDGKPLLTDIRYHHSGQIQQATLGNGITYQAQFDAMGRMTTQTRAGQTIAYHYDKAGNITRQGKQTYHYDKLDRLIGATQVRLPGTLEKGDIRYAYDANGNRTKQSIGQTSHRYQYARGSNRITAIDGQPLEYDQAGRLITDGHFSYRYDVRGRLATVTDNSGTIASYAYNEKGLRVRKTTHPGTTQETTTWFAYDPQGHLIVEYAAAHNNKPRLTREYLWLGDKPIALIDHASTASDIYFIHTDHLGTPRLVTDNQGREVWRWDSTPFGIGKPNDDPDGDGKKLTLNLRFPGQYYDEETGMHYNWWRYYNSDTGRYLTTDPRGLHSELNTYRYAQQNPAIFIDPYGLDVEVLIGGSAWYSHAAIRINNTVYSSGRYRVPNQERSFGGLAGTNVLKKQSWNSYLSQYGPENCPACGLTGYLLNVTKNQENKIAKFYRDLIDQSKISGIPNKYILPDDYLFVGNNCSSLVTEALDSGLPWYYSISLPGLPTPKSLEINLKFSPFLINKRHNYYLNAY